MIKKYMLETNNKEIKHTNNYEDIYLKMKAKEELINILKRTRNIIKTTALGMTCLGTMSIDMIVREVMNKKQPISFYTKDGTKILLWIGTLWFITYKVCSKLKRERGEYLDLALESSLINIKEELYQEFVPQKIL